MSKILASDFYNRAMKLSGREPDPFDFDDVDSPYYGKLVYLNGDYFIFKAHPTNRYVGFCGIHKVYTGIGGQYEWRMCGCEERNWHYGRYSLDSVLLAQSSMEFFQDVLKQSGFIWDEKQLKLVNVEI